MIKLLKSMIPLLLLGFAVAACAPQTPTASVDESNAAPAVEATDPPAVVENEIDEAEPETEVEVEESVVVEVTVESNLPVENDDSDTAAMADADAPENYTSSTENRADPSKYADLNIVTLLPPDAIPSIDNPTFLQPDEANDFYDSDELIIGVVFNGEARAYSIPHLSSHEIVNDEVGGVKIAVTW